MAKFTPSHDNQYRLWALGLCQTLNNIGALHDRNSGVIYISVGMSSCKRPNSVYRFLNQHASRDAFESAIYSASVDESAVETCFL